MKKILSLLMTLVMLCTVISTGATAFAADAKTVDAQIKGAAAYVLENASEFTVDNSADFLTILRSGTDAAKYKDAYVKSVRENLKKNGGKLLFGEYNYTTGNMNYTENFGLTAAAILCLKELGYNPASFEGFDLSAYFSKMNITKTKPNPYHYRFAIEAAETARAKKIINAYIKEYYVMGSGMNYWGYSCDNTAQFLTAIAPYAADYQKYVDDAKKVIQSYTKSNGAYCDSTYVTAVNADSTALAMMAYASLDDLATADKYYNWLIKGFSGSKTGRFTTDGSDNIYATKDALLALEYYKTAIDKKDAEEAAKLAKMKALDDSAVAITKLKAGKKKVRVVFNSVPEAAGYQIKYSTSKKFPSKKTKTLVIPYGNVKSHLFKKLRKNKKYYFKVRAYGVVDGKTIYGNWGPKKAIKTK